MIRAGVWPCTTSKKKRTLLRKLLSCSATRTPARSIAPSSAGPAQHRWNTVVLLRRKPGHFSKTKVALVGFHMNVNVLREVDFEVLIPLSYFAVKQLTF